MGLQDLGRPHSRHGPDWAARLCAEGAQAQTDGAWSAVLPIPHGVCLSKTRSRPCDDRALGTLHPVVCGPVRMFPVLATL